MNIITSIYKKLFKSYGPQGWWPLLNIKGSNPTKTGNLNGYHIQNYSYPKTPSQIFEICIGAILTQNTNWVSVEKALIGLKEKKLLNPINILDNKNNDIIKKTIRPCGYFNQKLKKIKFFSEFYISLNGTPPKREDLLKIWGIGEETCDSILLYAFKKNYFVVDAYTKRIFSRIGIIEKKESYKNFQILFEENLKKDLIIFQEYHALIVEHAKRNCKSKPICDSCILNKFCNFPNNKKGI